MQVPDDYDKKILRITILFENAYFPAFLYSLQIQLSISESQTDIQIFPLAIIIGLSIINV